MSSSSSAAAAVAVASTPVAVALIGGKFGPHANKNDHHHFSVDPPRPTTPIKQDLEELVIHTHRGSAGGSGNSNNNHHFVQQNSNGVSSWKIGCREAAVTIGPNGILNLPIVGGSDNGEFACLGDLKQERINYLSGKLESGDIILEIQAQKVAGYTQRDVEAWLNHCCRSGGVVTVKVTACHLLTKDLRQYLNTRFLKGSPDHDLQNTIRDNLYLRTVPCTTRSRREGEIDGVDYTFLSIDEFLNLERSGNLLESGIFEGNHYGTPKPPRESPLLRPPVPTVVNGTPPHFPIQTTILPGAHPSSEGKRRRNRSNVEAMASKSVEPNISLTSRSRTPSSTIGPANSNNSALKSAVEKFENFKLDPSTPPELGPLPANWEKAYTENGEPYFIDHASGTSQWLDPRLARVQKKSVEDCEDDELPYGWEKIDDPQFGTYYIDHINRQTQYENPVLQARRLKGQPQQHPQLTNGTVLMNPEEAYNGIGEHPPRDINDYHNDKSLNPGNGLNTYPVLHPPQTEQPMIQFTRNPAELRGTFITTTLVKSSRGFGFTIVGGDDEVKEFLQIKSVVPEGPAWQDGKLVQGDVLVFVDDICVLGFTHRDVVMMFQNIPIGDCVTLEVCRGYPLPFDPDDPNTEIVTTVAVSADDGNKGERLLPHQSTAAANYEIEGLDRSQRENKPDNGDSMVPGRNGMLHYDVEEAPDILDFYGRSQDCIPLEILTVGIVKGLMGFGFTIADSAHGQKVKKILDRPRCKNLAEGDVLLEINGRDVRGLEHSTVVQFLKDCPQGLEATITVQRGGQSSPNKNKSKILKMAKSFDENSNAGMPGFGKQESNFSRSFDSTVPPLTQYRSKTPTADIYGGHREKEVVPIRSKTPSAEVHKRSKSPTSTAASAKNTNIYFQNENHAHLISRGLVTQDSDHNNVDALGPGSLYGTTGSGGGGNRSTDASEGWQMNRNAGDTVDGSRIRPTKEPLTGSHVDHSNPAGPIGQPRYQEWPTNPRVNEESYYGVNYDRGRRDGEGSEALPYPTRTTSDQNRPIANVNIYDTSNYYARSNNSSMYNSIYGQNGQQPFVNSGIYGTNVNSLNSNNEDSGGQYQSGNARRQGTSFEREQPSPVTNVGRKTNSWYGPTPTNTNAMHPPTVDYFEFAIHLYKQETGFGFRIVGGTEEGSQVSIGHIVPGGAADLDGRLKSGDEIVSVDNQSVLNTSHHHVVQLMGQAAQGGRVALGIRRKVQHQDFIKNRQWDGLYPYDVTVNRRENEGFGFVIISSVTRAGSTIGRIIENSPAERCGCLHLGDRILAVNGKDISDLHHGDIVNLIKDSGFSVTLTIGPPQDDASSTTSASQKLSNASVVNAVAYSHIGDCDMLMRRNIYNSTPCLPFGANDSSGVRRSSTYGGVNIGGGGVGGGGVVYASVPVKQFGYSSQAARYNDSIQEENVLEDEQYYAVELFRGTRGFGFSIRGGKEFQNMPLFVLKIAEDGPASIDGRLKTGDQFVEINGVNTKDMTHAEAIDLIKQGGASVRLLVKRCSSGKVLPKHSSHSAVPLGNDRGFDSVGNQSSVVSPVIAGSIQQNNYIMSGTSGSHLSPTGILNSGPLGQSSPRVVLSDQDVYYPYWQYERGPV